MDKKTPSKKKPAKKNTTPNRTTTRKTKSTTSRSRKSTKSKTDKVEKAEAKPIVAKAKKTTAKKVVAKKVAAPKKSTSRTNSRKGKTIAKPTEKAKPVAQKEMRQKIAKPKQEITPRQEVIRKQEIHPKREIVAIAPKPVENNQPNTQTTYNKPNPNSNNNRNNNASNSHKKPSNNDFTITINQNVAILVDGNNIEKSIHSLLNTKNAMLDFDGIIPKLLRNRGLNRLIYFREGLHISTKLAERLHKNYFGTVVPCHKSADIPLSITATQLAEKVDTIIILSGDSDYVDLVRHLRSRGVRVEIAAIKQTTAKILIDEADFFTEITKKDCYVR